MIIVNGTIEPKIKQAGGIDPTTGYALPPAAERWGRPIPCQIVPQSFNRLAVTRQGEHVTAASYAVLVETQPPDTEQVRLKDAHGKVLGEFSIRYTEPLEAVGQLRLWV